MQKIYKQFFSLLFFILLLNGALANHQDCLSARVVCDISEQPSESELCNTVCSGNTNLVNGTNSCFASGLTRWGFYMFTIKQSGTLTFTISPQAGFFGSDNYNFALFDVSNGCGSLGNALRCSANDDGGTGDPTGLNMSATDTSEGTGGDGFCKYLDVICGHTYVLCLDIPGNGSSGFDLTFGGSCLFGAPQTQFIANPPSVCSTQPVNFTADTATCYLTNAFISYNWNFGANASPGTYSGLTPPSVTFTANGSQTITLATNFTTNDGTCSNSSSQTVNVSNTLSGSTSAMAASCGANNGTATVTVSGGATPFTYQWNTTPVQNTSTATGLASGNYSVTFTNSDGCSGTASVNVPSGAGPSVTTTCVNESSGGANDGSSSAAPSGGTTPYTYLWSNSQTSQNITGLASGTYSVTITDGAGCTAISGCSVTSASSCPTCQLPGWQYVKEITIDNSAIANSYSNFQELINLDTQTPIGQGKMNASGNDIRFVDSDCNTLLCYYIESGINTTNSSVWVMLPSLPANSTKTIYMFYGNASAPAASNFNCVFPNVLTVNSAVTLGGVQNYDWIDVQSSGNITVSNGQVLTLNARKVIVSGTINGNGAGYGPQAGPGAGCNGGGSTGGSGGGYGGNGGTGGGCAGGPANGTANGTDIDMGSGGGGSDCGPTGEGGGAVKITAGVAVINGTMTVNGGNAAYCCCGNSSEAAAAGSGGGILIHADYVSGGATLSARGGNGGDSDAKEGGGGGGGGRVKIFYCKSNTFSGGANVNGGSAGVGGQSGQQAGAAGTFTTNTFSCESIIVGAEEYSVFADAGTDTTYCSGSTAFIGSPAISGYTYAWTPASGLNSNSVSDPLVTLNNTNSTPLITDFILTASANGCTVKDTVQVTVNPIPISDAGIDQSYCSGNTVSIGTGITSGYSYSWSPSGGLSNSAISNPVVNLINTALTPLTTDFVVSTLANNCVSTDTITVTVYSMPVSDAGNDVAYCSGSTVTIGTASTPGFSYSWQPSNGLSNDSISNPTVIISNSGISNIVNNYAVTTTANGCTTSDTVQITVYPLPTSNFSATGPVCVEEGLVISYTGNADTSSATFIWDFDSATVLSSVGETYLVEWDTSGDKYVTLTVVQNGCISSIVQIVVTVNPPNANAGPDKTFCSGDSTTVGISASAGYAYSWSPSTGLTDPGIANPSLTLTNFSGSPVTADYTVTTTFAGCTVVDTVTVTIDPEPVSNAGPDINNLCSGSAALIGTSNDPAYTYSWLPTTGLSSSTVSSPTVTLNNTSATPLVLSYTVTTTFAAYGCTSEDSVSVTVYQIPTSGFTAPDSICINETALVTYTGNATPNASYQWNFGGGNASPGAGPGPHTVSWTSSGLYPITLNVTEICSSAAATAFDIFVKPFPVAFAGNDTSICSGTGITLGTSSTSGYVYSWSPVTGLSDPTAADPTLTLANTSQNPLVGNYVVTTSLNGCITIDSVAITVYQVPTSPFTLPVQLCGTEQASIIYTGNATSAANYAWNFDGGTVVSGTGQGPYSVYWQTTGQKNISLTVSENGCNSTLSVDSLDVFPLPISIAGTDAYFCSGGSFVMGTSSTAGYSYSWSPSYGLSDTAISNPTVTIVTQSGIDTVYYVITTYANNCASADTARVVVYSVPLAAISIPDTAQCLSGNSFSFTAGGSFLPAASFDWNFGLSANPPTSNLQNPTGISFAVSGIYQVSLIVNQYTCADTAMDTVEVYPMPLASAEPNDTAGCEPFSVNFFCNPNPANVTLVWNFGDFLSSSQQSPSHTYQQQGTFSVSLLITTPQSCSTLYDIGDIYVYPKPEANFTYTPEVVTNLHPVVVFTDESSLTTQAWNWSFGDGTTSVDENPLHYFPDSGIYLVTLVIENEFSCFDTVLDTVIVYPDYNFNVPNAFTPNNDGKNDVFMPEAVGMEGSEFEMFIFDRWGDLIFVTQSPKNPWDGMIDGKPVKEDVYVWMINTRDIFKKSHSYVGHVTVIR